MFVVFAITTRKNLMHANRLFRDHFMITLYVVTNHLSQWSMLYFFLNC
jgi:hypothetical protein